MRHPPYHLRANKSVDRASLLEAIDCLTRGERISDYTYYGMGGPFLEEYRLLYAAYPRLKLVSIERDEHTHRRQKFHQPCSGVDLRLGAFREFVRDHKGDQDKCIIWADYTDLKYEYIDDFMTLLQTVATRSMIKITLKADPLQYREREKEFREEFDALVRGSEAIPKRRAPFAAMIQGMMLRAAQKALRGQEREFQPVCSSHYGDGVGIYTLTGVVCKKSEQEEIKARFAQWQLRNVDWGPPMCIDVPELTTKERHHLQALLPCGEEPGRALQAHLGYQIDRDLRDSRKKLEQWALHHRYAATFVRATP